MSLIDLTNNNPILSRKKFFGFRFKSKETSKRQAQQQPQGYTQADLSSSYTPNVSRPIPRQAHNPAVHPLLAKPVAREENFVLLPNRQTSVKRKRDPNSPVRTSVKPRARDDSDSTEWNRYLQSYAEGRFNMSNPPEPPSNRPSGHLKPPSPPNDKDRVDALHKYYDVVRPSDTSAGNTSPTTRAQIDRFQRLIITARQTFQTKIALLSLVDEKRQFFKCEVGLGMNVETGREITFCGHTILSNEPMVVLNAEKDWRLAENPLVKGWPHIRFYAGAPIITPSGHAIGTVCIIDTEPRDSFDVTQRRKLTEFARLAMDEIDLAHKIYLSKQRKAKDASVQADPATAIPSGLRGMTAVASEAGTIDASIAGKDVRKTLEQIDDLEVVESNVTLANKEGPAQVKFKYGRNSTAEIDAGAKSVEKASRKKGDVKRPGKSVRVSYPSHSKRASVVRGKQPETSSDTPYYDSNTDKENQPIQPTDRGAPTDTVSKPSIRPKSALRSSSYGTQSPAEQRQSSTLSEEVTNLTVPDDANQHSTPDMKPSSVEHNPPETKGRPGSVFIPRTPAMPTYHDLQTKSNPELAAQLIARALRVDFVYFMRLTPITAKSPNTTGYPNAEVNLELLGCYGLPFPTISFSPFTHLEALRSELGMIYYSNTQEDGNTTDDSISNAKDNFRVGIVVPVWREYPRSSLTSASTSTRARASSSRGSTGKRQSIGSTTTTGTTTTTIANLRESCKKGVVVGVFSKRGDRQTFTRIEREYLKEWVSLRDHL